MKLNKNKPTFSQCKKMVKELNKHANKINIPIKFDIQKSLIQDDLLTKYKLLVFNLNDNTNKTKGNYTLNQLHNYLFEAFLKA